MSDLMNFFGQGGFDGAGVEAQGDFDVLPPGPQPIEIKAAEIRENSKKTGHYVKLDGLIFEGPQKGQHVFDQINIDNPSEQCVQIGLRVFKALKEAIGLPTITNTDQLLGGKCVACVKVKDGQNNVRTYEKYVPQQGRLATNAPQPQQRPVYAPQPAPATGGGAPQQPTQPQVAPMEVASAPAEAIQGKPPWKRP